MKKIFCPICKEYHETTSFDRDDPVLKCGHKFTIEMQTNELCEMLVVGMRDHAIKLMREQDISYKAAYEQVEAELRLDYHY